MSEKYHNNNFDNPLTSRLTDRGKTYSFFPNPNGNYYN